MPSVKAFPYGVWVMIQLSIVKLVGSVELRKDLKFEVFNGPGSGYPRWHPVDLYVVPVSMMEK